MRLPRAHHLTIEQLTAQLFIVRHHLQFQNLRAAISQKLIDLQQKGIGGWQFGAAHPADMCFWSGYLTDVGAIPPIIFAKCRYGVGNIVSQATKFPDLEMLWKNCDDSTLIEIYEVIGREARALGINALASFPLPAVEREALVYTISKKMLGTNIYPVYHMTNRGALQFAVPTKIRAMYCLQTDGEGGVNMVAKSQSVVISDWDAANWQTQLLRGVTLFSIPFEQAEESLHCVINMLQESHELKKQALIAVDNNLRLKKRIAALRPAQIHPNRIYKVLGDPQSQRLSQKLFSTFG